MELSQVLVTQTNRPWRVLQIPAEDRPLFFCDLNGNVYCRGHHRTVGCITMSHLLKLAMVKYKGQLQFDASGAGSFTMQEVADRLGLNIERARSVPRCLELQESIPSPPPYT
ncbi:MAG: hypothetical protein FRX49_10594 [Trebouxia sp. A1-2]|nr:MAG: hypothetical protein FRX49_10594 [Trebouxia sp. A1-2]